MSPYWKTLCAGVLALGMAYQPTAEASYKFKPLRGELGDHDPGPSKESGWPELFGETPNYRAIGQAVLGKGEKFRWNFGPMWYRGRLGKNEVKVFVVGQEGAQDENVSNRAFTGSTGTKTQKFLNYMGIYESYVFMNTFQYTIKGQLQDDPRFKWLEQGQDSPIVQYRHEMFNKMAEMNRKTLAVVMGVGTGGKATVATWVNTISGKKVCSSARNLAKCDTSILKKKLKLDRDVLVIGVPHPGGASPRNGGLDALRNIIRGFSTAADRVAQKMKQDPKWFNPDKQEEREVEEVIADLQKEYRYGNHPVPFKDFAFGTNWRMGDRGTTSNRRRPYAIQVFSAKGKYNNDGHRVSYDESPENTSSIKKGTTKQVPGMIASDLPYESPRANGKGHSRKYDYGPCGSTENNCEMAKLLMSWPDFTKIDAPAPVSHPSLGYASVYRGDLQDPEIVILADQYSHDDFFSGRALTGEMGQKLQTLLNTKKYKGKSYAIIRTLPVDVLGMKTADIKKIALAQEVREVRANILDQIGLVDREVLVLGSVAKAALQEYGSDIEFTDVTSRVRKYKTATPIPRVDLPVHTRWWMGTTGDRGARGEGGEEINGNYYKVIAPKWARYLQPLPLKEDEKDFLSLVPIEGRSAGDILEELGLADAQIIEDGEARALEAEDGGRLTSAQVMEDELDSMSEGERLAFMEIEAAMSEPAGISAEQVDALIENARIVDSAN